MSDKPAKKVVKAIPSPLTKGSITRLVSTYLDAKAAATNFTSQADSIKKRLRAYVETHGEPDDRGHLWFDLPAQVDGRSRLKMERRVSQSLSREKAEAVLGELKLLEECTTMVPVLDEDAILAANAEGRLSDDDLAKMYPASESFAFYVL